MLALACLACACATAGCALLVSYDGFGGGSDAGSDGMPERDSANDGSMAELDGNSEGAGDGAADAAANGCRGAVPGVYCGRALPNYTGSVQDLVQCLGNGTTGAVMSCSNGCATMPDGRQDVCNPCATHPDGSYCLQEIVLSYPGNDVLIVCSGGAVSASSLCTNSAKGCMSSACL